MPLAAKQSPSASPQAAVILLEDCLMLMPPNDPARDRPLDHPTPERPFRLYVALTNHCNRSCPWCSTCSSPRGSTWLRVADYEASLPRVRPFQVQLEGGEPTLHPEF